MHAVLAWQPRPLRCKVKYVAYCTLVMLIDLEDESFVEDWVERLAVNFGLHLLLLVRHDVDLDVRIGCPTHVHCRQFGRLDHPNCQLQTHGPTHHLDIVTVLRFGQRAVYDEHVCLSVCHELDGRTSTVGLIYTHAACCHGSVLCPVPVDGSRQN